MKAKLLKNLILIALLGAVGLPLASAENPTPTSSKYIAQWSLETLFNEHKNELERLTRIGDEKLKAGVVSRYTVRVFLTWLGSADGPFKANPEIVSKPYAADLVRALREAGCFFEETLSDPYQLHGQESMGHLFDLGEEFKYMDWAFNKIASPEEYSKLGKQFLEFCLEAENPHPARAISASCQEVRERRHCSERYRQVPTRL